MKTVGARGSGRLSAMGEAGRMRVNKYFSFNAFASHLHDYVTIETLSAVKGGCSAPQSGGESAQL